MSVRSGYDDGCDGWELIRWRGAVTSAIRGRRGQAFLHELRDALDAMDQKELIEGYLEDGGKVCAVGCVARARGMLVEGAEELNADTLDVANALVREVMFVNDDDWGIWSEFDRVKHKDIPTWQADIRRRRWERVRRWVDRQIREEAGT